MAGEAYARRLADWGLFRPSFFAGAPAFFLAGADPGRAGVRVFLPASLLGIAAPPASPSPPPGSEMLTPVEADGDRDRTLNGTALMLRLVALSPSQASSSPAHASSSRPSSSSSNNAPSSSVVPLQSCGASSPSPAPAWNAGRADCGHRPRWGGGPLPGCPRWVGTDRGACGPGWGVKNPTDEARLADL